MPTPPKNLNEISALVQLIKDLRGPNGCPWDKEQDHASLAPYAIEETFEMVEAIESKNDTEICEELGDVLFQVVLHSALAEERQAFDFSNVVQGISEKIVRRHPHVFSDVKVQNTDEVLKNWETIKAAEKKLKNISPDKALEKNLFNSPKDLPALQVASKIGEKTAKYAFDWNNVPQVLAQLKEEIKELEDVLQQKIDPIKITHELGDILFSAVQLARHLHVDAETALRQCNQRFKKRFIHMVTSCESDIENFKKLSAAEKEKLWQNAKLF